MKLFSFGSVDRLEQEVARVAHEAVDRCETLAHAQIRASLHGQSIHAARGYIRAKIGGCLRKEIRLLNTNPQGQSSELPELALELALESLTQSILGDLIKAKRLDRVIRLAA